MSISRVGARLLLIGALCLTGGVASWGAEELAASLSEQLQQGQIAAAEASLQKTLAGNPDDSQARFGLGVVKVFSAIEKLGQDQYRYGALGDSVRNLPVLRFPVPVNPAPQEVTYQQLRQVFVDFQGRIMEAEQELAKVDVAREVKLPLELGLVHLDITGDGQVDASEGLYAILKSLNVVPRTIGPQGLRVQLDGGDVLWLRGYCHFLAGFCDVVLAYDHQRLFDHTAHRIYPNLVRSDGVVDRVKTADERSFDDEIVDLITAIHLASFPLKEPNRMESARQHWLAMIRTSRESWALIEAEKDDDYEWLPNPKQEGVLQIPVSRELIDGWQQVLAEMEDLLEGRKLVPFWRDYTRVVWGQDLAVPDVGRGFNLKRFFAEPRDFDLVLMMQGSAALPYLENGPLSRPETWDSLTRVFQGRFFGFAVWFN